MKYRLRIYPAMETEEIYSKAFCYETLAEMLAARDTVATLLLFIQDTMEVMNDYSNAFILYEYIDGFWEEYDEHDTEEYDE
jgi:hypothetical protein